MLHLSIRRTLRKLLSPELVHQVARDSGACVRLRKVDPFVLVWTLVLGSLSGRVRRLSELRRLYRRVAGVTLEESSFYDRFTPALSTMLSTLLEHVLQHAWGAGRAATGQLAAFRDILATDSTVIRVHRMLAKHFAGTRTHQGGAALKAHVVFAVAGTGKQTVKLTAALKLASRGLAGGQAGMFNMGFPLPPRDEWVQPEALLDGPTGDEPKDIVALHAQRTEAAVGCHLRRHRSGLSVVVLKTPWKLSPEAFSGSFLRLSPA